MHETLFSTFSIRNQTFIAGILFLWAFYVHPNISTWHKKNFLIYMKLFFEQRITRYAHFQSIPAEIYVTDLQG